MSSYCVFIKSPIKVKPAVLKLHTHYRIHLLQFHVHIIQYQIDQRSIIYRFPLYWSVYKIKIDRLCSRAYICNIMVNQCCNIFHSLLAPLFSEWHLKNPYFDCWNNKLTFKKLVHEIGWRNGVDNEQPFYIITKLSTRIVIGN